MKSIIYVFIIAIGFVGFNHQVVAQSVQKSPKAVITQRVGLTDITITYHRPGLKGRSMASLAPNGAVWRTGANNATAFLTSNAITIGGKDLPAGNYSLWTIPAAGEWTIIINKNWDQHLADKYDESEDILRLTVVPEVLQDIQESLMYEVTSTEGNKGIISMSWEKLKISFEIEVI